jgi:glycosyltransferase involved in cell wall biosynthesis
MGMLKHLSVIIPVFNEEENVQLLHQRLQESLRACGRPYEIIYVDDGSTDATFSRLRRLAEHDTRVCIVQLKRNFGQTIALSAGIEQSTGSILVFMDGDLQNDPRDIPRLLAKLDEGYDVVSGWRKQRKDALLSRKLPSWLANRLIARVTGVQIHDYGCSLKVYHREVFTHLRLYGEMHRFLPAYAALVGARITELEVAHHPRRFGTSKYGLSRTVRVLLDLLRLKFEGSFATKPIYGLGIPGLLWLLLGCLFLLFVPAHKISSRPADRSFFLSNAVACFGFGTAFIFMGLLAELLMRTYYESQRKPTYEVKTLVVPSEKMLPIDEMNAVPGSPFSTWGGTWNGREILVEQEL